MPSAHGKEHGTICTSALLGLVLTNLGFILFGEGNVPWLVRELINKAEPIPERRPRVIIG